MIRPMQMRADLLCQKCQQYNVILQKVNQFGRHSLNKNRLINVTMKNCVLQITLVFALLIFGKIHGQPNYFDQLSMSQSILTLKEDHHPENNWVNFVINIICKYICETSCRTGFHKISITSIICIVWSPFLITCPNRRKKNNVKLIQPSLTPLT